MIESSVVIQDIKMDYVCFGKGNIPLVIIPGLSLNRVKGFGFSLWYMYRMFAKEYKVYIFDRKDVVEMGYSIQDMANELALAMKELQIANACVFGVSQGGMIAQYLAIAYPELVSKVVLGVTCARCNEFVSEAIDTWIELLHKDMKLFVEDMLKRMYSTEYVRKNGWVFPLISKLYKHVDKKRFEILAKACLTCDCYDELSKITCPVLVLGGKEDKVVGVEGSLELIEKLKCEYYLYDNYGHSAYEEAKDFNQRIYTFLK